MPTVVDLRDEFFEKRRSFADQLRELRTDAKLTMPALVDKVGNGLSVNAYKKYEWADGQQVPDDDRVEQIAAVLGPEAAVLIGLRDDAAEARQEWKRAQKFPDKAGARSEPRYVPWDRYRYSELLRRSLASVIATCTLAESEHGKVVGWRHFIENESLPVTPVSSAYGLRILLMANHAGSVPSVGRIVESILALENESGGWSARTQNRLARVEVSGPVLHALRLAGLPDDELMKRVEHYEEILDRDFDQAAWVHTTVLTTACIVLSAVHPESGRIRQLLAALQAAALIGEDGSVSWTQSIVPERAARLSPSIVHTARAICCIALAPSEAAREIKPLAEAAVRWLAEQESYNNPSEIIERPLTEQIGDYLDMRHFTAGWVARALALGSQWTEVSPAALWRAEDNVLRAVGHDGLWRWESGEQPIWMTFQGLMALKDIVIAEHDINHGAN